MITHVYDFLERSLLTYSDKKLFVEFSGKTISYKEFDIACKKLATAIIDKEIYNSPILIILPKGIDCLISFMGVALSGNYYTLLDEKTPLERIKKVVSILNPKLIITFKELNLPNTIDTIFSQDIETFSINNEKIAQVRAKHIDTNLLYVFFTSGSTGIPKGVSIAHKSVIDYAFWVCETFNFTDKEILANQAPFYFDNSILDIFSTMKVGATLHILPTHLFAFPTKIMDYLQENHINTIFWVPSVLIYFANANALKGYDSLKLQKILFCGEIMPTKQLNIWRKFLPQTIFANLYGPTEITDVCSYYIVNRDFKDNDILPIGKACNNTELLVFDEKRELIQPEQVGVKGELYVRGCSLSLGYYNDKERTSQVFIQNPLHDNYLDLVYRTGDIVSYNEFGELLCYGRIDNQIKYMGHRIELGEIEVVINAHQDVKNCACIFKEEIICFYESDNDINLQLYLKDKLLSYMLPKHYIRVDKFKLNANGKIDRKALHEI